MTSGTKYRVVVAHVAGDRRLTTALAGDPGIEIVATTSEALRAVTLTRRLRPEAIVLDASLPDEGAYAAARRIMTEIPTPIIVAVDAESRRAGTDRQAALQAGAVLVVVKPPEAETPGFATRRSGLIAAVRAMAPMHVEGRQRREPLEADETGAVRHAAIVAIAASTGGPAAFSRILCDLPADFGAPILLTQHIARGFAEGMVRWLNGACALSVKLAEHGELLRPATVYVAGDDRHLTARDERTIALTDEPPAHGHRPSASVMFQSVATVFGSASLGAVLTGMGRDGIDGLTAIHRAGGAVVAQDETSSAVFGMPKAAIDAGIVHRVLPLSGIARHLRRSVAAA
jgi:two-component system, chemotaxis family, protein-glutamate methylesterase/glutaminase